MAEGCGRQKSKEPDSRKAENGHAKKQKRGEAKAAKENSKKHRDPPANFKHFSKKSGKHGNPFSILALPPLSGALTG